MAIMGGDSKYNMCILSRDTINRWPLTAVEGIVLVKSNVGEQQNCRKINGLPASIELAVGMEVKVTTNVNTEINMGNRSCGEVTKIILDPCEQMQHGSKDIITLDYPPLYILVKLQHTHAMQLHGLEAGKIPTVPEKMKIGIYLRLADGTSF